MSKKILELQKMQSKKVDKVVSRKSGTSGSCTLKSAISLFC